VIFAEDIPDPGAAGGGNAFYLSRMLMKTGGEGAS
jgi:hypothetical protein